MATYNWPPDLHPSEFDWQLKTGVMSARSPRTGTAVHVDFGGDVWVCSFKFDALRPHLKRQLEGIVWALHGPEHRVLFPDRSYTGARGNATGTLLATGNPGARLLTVSGFTGLNPVLRAGDLLRIGDRRYGVPFDVNASGGSASFRVEPPLRAAYSAAAVTLSPIHCPMSFVDNEQARVLTRAPNIGSGSYVMMEALP